MASTTITGKYIQIDDKYAGGKVGFSEYGLIRIYYNETVDYTAKTSTITVTSIQAYSCYTAPANFQPAGTITLGGKTITLNGNNTVYISELWTFYSLPNVPALSATFSNSGAGGKVAFVLGAVSGYSDFNLFSSGKDIEITTGNYYINLETFPSYTVTVEDRVGNSSGTLLGSGTYSVYAGTTVSANSLRTTTYSGYTYSSCTNATITKNTTLYRYFTSNAWTMVDVSPYSSPLSAETQYTATIKAGQVYRIAVQFAYPGTVTFYSSASSDTYGYFSLAPEFNKTDGGPTTALQTDDDDNGNLQFLITQDDVDAKTTYYIWARFYSKTSAGDITVTIIPPPAVWFIASRKTYSDAEGFITQAVNIGAREVDEITVTFKNRGKATVYTSGGTLTDTKGYVVNGSVGSPGIDSTGVPISYTKELFDDDSGDGWHYKLSWSVVPGVTYYIYTRGYSETSSGNTTIYIEAPGELTGALHIYGSDGAYHRCAVWIYKGDNAGPNNDGWHRAVPKIYSDANGYTGFHTCG